MMGKKSISLYIKLYRDNINIEKWLIEQGKKNLSRINRLDMKTLLEDVGIMYTFLETLYTTEMVNDKYVQEFVNKI